MSAETSIPAATCPCGQPRRPGHWDCPKCHRERQKVYRNRHRDEFLRLQQVERFVQGNDPETRTLFESRFRTRNVVTREDGDTYPATVVGFLPYSRVSVIDTDDQTHTVEVAKLMEDMGRVTE